MSTAQPVTFSGLNGFDFNAVITATLQSESQPLTALQAQQTAVKNRDSALTTLGNQVAQLETTATSLASQMAFTSVSASSSDTTVASAAAGTGGIAGTYDLSVAHTAKVQVTSSTSGYANTTDIAADGGSISFTIGGQTTTPIQITGQTSLTGLASQINSQNSGVFAAVVNDGTNKKLVVMSRNTGAANGFTVNDSLTNSTGTAPVFAAGQSSTSGNSQDAADASFTLNGVSISSASNTITDAIPGATITLTKAGDTTVSVAPDYSNIQTTLQTLVTQYNSLQQFVTQQSATGQPLAQDLVARQVMSDIRSGIMSATSNGGQYQYLAEIGLQFAQDGTLSLDQSTFTAALNSNPQDLQKLFQGDGTNGAFSNLLTKLQNDDATAGLISTTQTSDQTAIKNFADRITAQQTRLDLRRTELTKLYSAADQAMTQLRAAAQPLAQLGTTSLFSSLT